MSKIKGIITIFVNRKAFEDNEDEAVTELIKKNNQKVLDKAKEAGYPLMFVTTTNEASRAVKIDLDQPFPLRAIDGEYVSEEEST